MTQTGAVTAGEHPPPMTRAARSLTSQDDAIHIDMTMDRPMPLSSAGAATVTTAVTVIGTERRAARSEVS